MAMLVVGSLVPAVVLATPPATDASCAGIKNAYPILGTQCQSTYGKINHSISTKDLEKFDTQKLQDTYKALQDTYKARAQVMEIFKKATLCNGMYGADKAAQVRFTGAEAGHLNALAELYTNMKKVQEEATKKKLKLEKLPPEYTKARLSEVTISKGQCK